MTIEEDISASQAIHRMMKNDLGRLIVTNPSGEMVGIITRTDLMNAIKVVTRAPGPEPT